MAKGKSSAKSSAAGKAAYKNQVTQGLNHVANKPVVKPAFAATVPTDKRVKPA